MEQQNGTALEDGASGGSEPGTPILTRRDFLAGSVAALALPPTDADAQEAGTRQATGAKVGEVTATSARVWTRLTAAGERNRNGEVLKGHIQANAPAPAPVDAAKLEGACPGAAGQVRVRCGTREDLGDASVTPWVPVTAATDFTHQFPLTGLKPGTVYHYAAETAGPSGSPAHGTLRGRFETAPAPGQAAEFTFCVLTCMMYAHLDHSDGFHIFPAIAAQHPKFLAFTGDNVYYDSEEPRAVRADVARYHWERMFSLPRHVDLIRNVATYWEKDDHDTLRDDCWPATPPMGRFTFAEGQQIFRQQVPLGEVPYRTFRWGKSLQVWLTESRDFRSPNTMPDGPEKSIWGRAQKEWLKRTLLESDATWKVLISPNPLVGPDRQNKHDNHANDNFQNEGAEFRAWAKEHLPDTLFVICGDRHWQYHSVHPQTGLNEFSVGPASDEHASGTPGLNPEYHRFHRVKGGFLSVTVRERLIRFQHHDVKGAVVYRWEKERKG